MAGFTTTNNEHLIRANLWTAEIKEIFQADVFAQKYVKMIDFPDGTTLNIPSIGQAEVSDYTEGAAVKYTAMDTGNFTFTINKYKSAATYITDAMKQDSFYMAQLVAAFVPKMMRALEEAMEADVLAVAPDGQTASNANVINGANHRWIGSGTNETVDVKDFALVLNSLQMANVPMTNLIGIVHPSVEYKLNTLTNIVSVSNNPMWEGIVEKGFRTGLRFSKNIYGIDCYVSQFLKTGLTDTIGGRTAGAGVANLFFSAAPDAVPFIGAVRQAPKVDSEYNKDFQREEYVVTCRYGYKLYRPEGVVVLITDTDQVN